MDAIEIALTCRECGEVHVFDEVTTHASLGYYCEECLRKFYEEESEENKL